MKWSLALTALVLGALAPFAGSPYQRREVSAIELAFWIKDRKPGLRVIDLRSQEDFDAFHIPTSVRATPSSFHANADETIVIAGGDAAKIDGPNVYVLRGGVLAWVNEVTKGRTAIGNYFGHVRRGGC
jgi:rhodanese-related sulfurtransferase